MAVASIFTFGVFAQDNDDHGPLLEGQWLIEINTGSWATGSTAFSLTSVDGNTMWSIGAEAGYFVANNFAIKAGLGYSDDDFGDGLFAYKIGVKYYLGDTFPLGVDFTGVSSDFFDGSWVGVQGGYAWFVTEHLSIEPTLRYNITLDEDEAESIFQGLIGFAFHF